MRRQNSFILIALLLGTCPMRPAHAAKRTELDLYVSYSGPYVTSAKQKRQKLEYSLRSGYRILPSLTTGAALEWDQGLSGQKRLNFSDPFLFSNLKGRLDGSALQYRLDFRAYLPASERSRELHLLTGLRLGPRLYYSFKTLGLTLGTKAMLRRNLHSEPLPRKGKRTTAQAYVESYLSKTFSKSLTAEVVLGLYASQVERASGKKWSNDDAELLLGLQWSPFPSWSVFPFVILSSGSSGGRGSWGNAYFGAELSVEFL